MKKHFGRTLLAAAMAVCCLFGSTMTAFAAVTVDDVANKARELGFSEDMIQLGYNEWATGLWTQQDLDDAYAQLLQYEKESNEKFESIFDTPSSSVTTTPSTTPPADSSSNTESAAPAETTPSSSGTPSSTTPSVDFVNMTLDEKIAYVNTMSESEKDAFLANLSPEERNSIIKQLSLDDKAELMQGYIDVAQGMGMNVVVDSLTDTNISVTIRNQEGVVIDKAAVGVTIDETGISYTHLLVTAAVSILLSLLGLAAIYRHLCRTDGGAQ